MFKLRVIEELSDIGWERGLDRHQVFPLHHLLVCDLSSVSVPITIEGEVEPYPSARIAALHQEDGDSQTGNAAVFGLHLVVPSFYHKYPLLKVPASSYTPISIHVVFSVILVVENRKTKHLRSKDERSELACSSEQVLTLRCIRI